VYIICAFDENAPKAIIFRRRFLGNLDLEGFLHFLSVKDIARTCDFNFMGHLSIYK